MSEIKVCPECDSPQIRTRTNDPRGTGNRLDPQPHHCNNCHNSFDEPRRREPKHSGGAPPETILRWAVEGQQ